MSLTRGTRLGVYEVTVQIGEGGMGQVYRAHDTRLNRDVAIKVLPDSVAHDVDRLARFRREAQTLALLNHPNIAHIHGLEESGGLCALVMELIEGEDLSWRIDRGAIPIDEALRIAKQIAEALEAAHEQGIVHRDLKPANIKVRADGLVKVLDFGIAKAVAPPGATTVTLTAHRTEAGTIVGTPAYMSPEQARGETADRRTDIWSFGVVLYELLTGTSPFSAPTTADTLSRVIGTQPDHTLLPSDTPTVIRRLVRRCLEKDPKRRLQHMGDVRLEIEEAVVATTSGTAPAGTPDDFATGGRLGRVAGSILLAALAGLGGWLLGQRSVAHGPVPVVRLSIPSLGAPFRGPFGNRHLAITDDGARVAYASAGRLWIRHLGQTQAVAIEVVSSNPFFSPSGEWVGFFTDVGLWKVPVGGGVPVPILTTAERPGGATWRADGTIVFATSVGLYEVRENGGAPRLLVKPDPRRQELRYAWPQFMPDGQSILFTVIPEGSIDGAQLVVLNLKTLETRIVLKGGSAARYSATGHLLYAAGQTLKAVAFDPGTQQTRGDPVSFPDIEVTNTPDNGAAEFAASSTGTLVFMSPDTPGRQLRTLSWVDRNGKEEPLAIAPGRYTYPRISPDGTRIALDIAGANRDIWIWNLQRPNLTRVTEGPTEDLVPVWSLDGRRVFFASDRAGSFDVYSEAADGSTPAKVEFSGPGTQMPTALSPDGARLLVVENFKGLSLVTLGRSDRIEPLLRDEFSYWLGVISPDGHWLAYESNESGNKVEIFLRPFPEVTGRREKVSLDGGRYPVWGAKDTGELYYMALDGGMMAASVTLSPSLNLGRVTKLFDWEKPPRGITGRVYDLSPVDGRFLMTKPAATGSDETGNISVVLNWVEGLKLRALETAGK